MTVFKSTLTGGPLIAIHVTKFVHMQFRYKYMQDSNLPQFRDPRILERYLPFWNNYLL